MKKHLSVIALMAALLGGGALSAHAFLDPPDDFGGPPAGREMGPERRFTRMAEQLKLTDAQKEQIKAILKAERERVAPVREKLTAGRKKFHEAAEAEKFDEAAVRALAATQAGLQTELMVSRARVHSQINAILTPEQRELAKKLHPMKGEKGRDRHKRGDR